MIQNQFPTNLQTVEQTYIIIAAGGGKTDTTTSTEKSNDVLSQGGVAAAIIIALAVLALALMRFQKAQLESIATLIEKSKEESK